MQKTITTLIPQYGELNRICKDWIVSHTFSFEKQKFIVDFYSEWSDIKAFEQAIRCNEKIYSEEHRRKFEIKNDVFKVCDSQRKNQDKVEE